MARSCQRMKGWAPPPVTPTPTASAASQRTSRISRISASKPAGCSCTEEFSSIIDRVISGLTRSAMGWLANWANNSSDAAAKSKLRGSTNCNSSSIPKVLGADETKGICSISDSLRVLSIEGTRHSALKPGNCPGSTRRRLMKA
ncbi:Uncharacterised protein [Bordetella pertussis]|nr:Uncharacterised protein [Bordetella pertussis]